MDRMVPAGKAFIEGLVEKGLSETPLTAEEGLRILVDRELELLSLLQAAFKVREKTFGKKVRVQILQNAQNGLCPEDCNYCAQAKDSEAQIVAFKMKPDAEIMQGAREAAEAGMYRYCIVLSGRGPTGKRVEEMADLVKRIKNDYPVEVCLSAGFIDPEMAKTLKEAGLDRYNHNLNTSEGRYGSICSTHDYADRLKTLQAAKGEGLEVCSGLIIGMGEGPEEVVELAQRLRDLDARSIPVNFYVHVEGAKLGEMNALTPEYCLRALCLFRFMNPTAEVRAAGGREAHLRSQAALALYPANSIFSEGYLNVGGDAADATIQMVLDAGFEVETVEEK